MARTPASGHEQQCGGTAPASRAWGGSQLSGPEPPKLGFPDATVLTRAVLTGGQLLIKNGVIKNQATRQAEALQGVWWAEDMKTTALVGQRGDRGVGFSRPCWKSRDPGRPGTLSMNTATISQGTQGKPKGPQLTHILGWKPHGVAGWGASSLGSAASQGSGQTPQTGQGSGSLCPGRGGAGITDRCPSEAWVSSAQGRVDLEQDAGGSRMLGDKHRWVQLLQEQSLHTAAPAVGDGGWVALVPRRWLGGRGAGEGGVRR